MFVSGRSDPSKILSCKLLTLKIYKILGQAEVALVNEEQSAGWKEVQWNARPTTGQRLDLLSGQATTFSSGVYFYKLDAGSFTQIKKMLLLR